MSTYLKQVMMLTETEPGSNDILRYVRSKGHVHQGQPYELVTQDGAMCHSFPLMFVHNFDWIAETEII